MHHRKQRGMSLLGMLCLALAGGFILLCCFRVLPAYFDNMYIAEGLKSLNNPEGQLSELSKDEVKKQLSTFFRLNNVRNFPMKEIEIKRDKNGLSVKADYEKRVHLLHNIDVVMTFENHWHSSNPQECCSPKSE